MASSKNQRLAARIRARQFFVAPGVFDMISARICDTMGFTALYMTGYGTVASHLGVADAGLASFRDMVDRAARIAGGTETPLIADADTGYGGPLNVRQTVRGYEAAGVSAMHIEDQVDPKKCGHTPGTRVIPVADMQTKIKVALDARNDDNFLIIARTDSRAGEGLDEACRRGEAYIKAGCDVLFVEALRTVEEMEIVARRFDHPLMANISNGGVTPVTPAETLSKIGYAFAIYPGVAFNAAAEAIKRASAALLRDGDSLKLDVPLMPLEEMHRVMGFPDVWAFEEKWSGAKPASGHD